LAVFAVFLGIAHLSSGDAFGGPTSMPWAIELWGARRHPTQVYEILPAILALVLVWRLRRTRTFPGFLCLAWLAIAAGSRPLVEPFRGDSVTIFGALRGAQLASLSVLAAVLASLHLRARGVVGVDRAKVDPAK